MTQKRTQKTRQQMPVQDNLNRHIQHFEGNSSVVAMQRKIVRLERSLARRENEVWTLKQLLLYR